MRKTTSSALRNVRRTRTINQADLAELIGISQQTLSKYERGRLVPTPDLQGRIAAILGVNRQDIFPDRESAVAS